jgi:hypothetical protein
MKSMTLIAVFMFNNFIISAQTTEKKTATVHIKKVVMVNGVEKVTDTTYTTDNPSKLVLDEGGATVQEWPGKDGKMQKVVIIDNNQEHADLKFDDKDPNTIIINSDKDVKGNAAEKRISIHMPQGPGDDHAMVINIGGEMSPEEEAAFTLKCDSSQNRTVVIKKVTSKDGKDQSTEEIKVIVARKLIITNASETDLRTLDKSTGTTDGKLSVEKMDFYPNPNNGRFNLSFSLPEKGDTEVKILNESGTPVFSEKLANFSGTYMKEVDITRSPKGVYFVRVEQGRHSLVKKVVVD